MEWQQLEYFRTAAKMEHFRKSAEMLSISQPALSRSITNLEEELGVSLFDRTGRSVKLNKFGQAFLKRVENGLKEISIGIEEINQLKNPHTGVVSLAFLQTLGVTILPEIISNFNHLYPHIEFQLYQDKTLPSINKLLNREVDLCLIGASGDHPNINWHPLLNEELFLYVPANHRFAAKKSIALSEAAGESFVGIRRGMGLRQTIDKFCMEAGFTPVVKFEGEDIPTLAALVSAGIGVGILPAFSGMDLEKMKKIPISRPSCHREIGLAWLNGDTLSPSTELFRNYIISLYNGKS